MARPFYSAPVKYRPDFPLLPGQVRVPPPHVLTGPPPPPPPTGLQPPGFTSDKPWMTPTLVAEIRRRNFLQNRAARSSCQQDRSVAEQQRHLVNRLVSEAKERFCLAHPERTDEILASDRRARPFHCGSCDRSYGTQQQLDEHCREHVRCGLDDCPFTAHPRVVEKHVTMQHQTGLAKVIMALNTPEAIARWREQRRANFCRPESAARRQAEQAERAARGIRLPARGGRFPPAAERPGRGRGGRGRGRGRGARLSRPTQPDTALSDSEEEGTPRGLPSFAGILAPGDPGQDGAVPAGAEAGSGAGEAASSPAPVNGSRSGGAPERPLPDSPPQAEAEPRPQGHSGGAATTAEPGVTPAPSRPAPHQYRAGAGGRGRRGRGRGGGADQPPRKRRRPLSLLEKLLAPDIRRERNIILQCVRHVVNENFFDCRPLGGVPAAPHDATAAGDSAREQRPEKQTEGPASDPGRGAVTTGDVADQDRNDTVPAGDGPGQGEAATGSGPDQDQDRSEDHCETAQTEDGPGPDRVADQQPTGAGPEPPAPRLLSGAYYDSDSISDSD